jgi:2-polyprenyl-3-methyl-5-hydroxy-6-metoxy-1,4-benzoquinol methylase
MTTATSTKDSADAYFAHSRSEMLELLPRTYSRVLEIGCGIGAFSRLLDPAAETWGVEPHPASAELARGRISKVLCGTYEGVADLLPDGYFDLVVCNDVIEHMGDHDKFFREIQRKIRPNGYLIGSVPNVRYFRNMVELILFADWQYRDQGILDRTHQRFFTKRSLRRSLLDAGFGIDELRGITSAAGHVKDWADVLKVVTLIPFISLTLGLMSDIRFLQMAFRVSLNSHVK